MQHVATPHSAPPMNHYDLIKVCRGLTHLLTNYPTFIQVGGHLHKKLVVKDLPEPNFLNYLCDSSSGRTSRNQAKLAPHHTIGWNLGL